MVTQEYDDIREINQQILKLNPIIDNQNKKNQEIKENLGKNGTIVNDVREPLLTDTDKEIDVDDIKSEQPFSKDEEVNAKIRKLNKVLQSIEFPESFITTSYNYISQLNALGIPQTTFDFYSLLRSLPAMHSNAQQKLEQLKRLITSNEEKENEKIENVKFSTFSSLIKYAEVGLENDEKELNKKIDLLEKEKVKLDKEAKDLEEKSQNKITHSHPYIDWAGATRRNENKNFFERLFAGIVFWIGGGLKLIGGFFESVFKTHKNNIASNHVSKDKRQQDDKQNPALSDSKSPDPATQNYINRINVNTSLHSLQENKNEIKSLKNNIEQIKHHIKDEKNIGKKIILSNLTKPLKELQNGLVKNSTWVLNNDLDITSQLQCWYNKINNQIENGNTSLTLNSTLTFSTSDKNRLTAIDNLVHKGDEKKTDVALTFCFELKRLFHEFFLTSIIASGGYVSANVQDNRATTIAALLQKAAGSFPMGGSISTALAIFQSFIQKKRNTKLNDGLNNSAQYLTPTLIPRIVEGLCDNLIKSYKDINGFSENTAETAARYIFTRIQTCLFEHSEEFKFNDRTDDERISNWVSKLTNTITDYKPSEQTSKIRKWIEDNLLSVNEIQYSTNEKLMNKTFDEIFQYTSANDTDIIKEIEGLTLLDPKNFRKQAEKIKTLVHTKPTPFWIKDFKYEEKRFDELKDSPLDELMVYLKNPKYFPDKIETTRIKINDALYKALFLTINQSKLPKTELDELNQRRRKATESVIPPPSSPKPVITTITNGNGSYSPMFHKSNSKSEDKNALSLKSLARNLLSKLSDLTDDHKKDALRRVRTAS